MGHSVDAEGLEMIGVVLVSRAGKGVYISKAHSIPLPNEHGVAVSLSGPHGQGACSPMVIREQHPGHGHKTRGGLWPGEGEPRVIPAKSEVGGGGERKLIIKVNFPSK